MKYKKISVFISSNYDSLKKERTEFINCLLNAQMIPICMEHFTTASSQKFEEIKRLIDQSDVLVMLLGEVYGSCDDNGISWTENEYRYAMSINKTCYVVKTEAYMTLLNRLRSGGELSSDQMKQIKFGEGIGYAQSVSSEKSINVIFQQIISGIDTEHCIGWVRNCQADDNLWQQKNRYLDLSGKWYHLHLKEDDISYMRAGNVTIEQNFSPEKYTNLHFKAVNYNVEGINPESKTIILNKLKRTVWSGDYYLKDDERVIGVYDAERFFKGEYGEWVAERGLYRGVHALNIVDEDGDQDTTDETIMLSGSFHDVFPSHKTGLLYLFRKKELRYQFLYDNFHETLVRNIKE